MRTEDIRNELFALQDKAYRDFQANLIPAVSPDRMIGVRTPALRALAKRIAKDGDTEEFLQDLPHMYFEENQLHAFLISRIRDFDRCLEETERFLPYMDNWATCDQKICPAFRKHTKELMPHIDTWLASSHIYTVRYAIGTLMRYYLDENFDPSYVRKVCSVSSDEYYIMMMQAWYLATALSKQWDSVIPVLEDGSLDRTLHNKTIQKAVESFRISEEKKAVLRTLRRK